MSSRPEPVVATPRMSRRGAHLVPDVGQALVDHLDRAAVGLDVDLLDHLAVLVEHHQVGGDRADVDAQVGADLAVGAGTRRASRGRAAG